MNANNPRLAGAGPPAFMPSASSGRFWPGHALADVEHLDADHLPLTIEIQQNTAL
jgi:hypothetical protein